MNLKEETLANECVYAGRIFQIERSLVRLPNGQKAQRDVVRHPGAVAILAFSDRDSVILVRQFRYATGEELWEVPAGKLEPGEDPAACAARELREETGYAPGALERVASFYTAPGFSSELLHLYEARDLRPVSGSTDPDEFLEVYTVALQEALLWLDQGKIRDAKTLVALLMTARHR